MKKIVLILCLLSLLCFSSMADILGAIVENGAHQIKVVCVAEEDPCSLIKVIDSSPYGDRVVSGISLDEETQLDLAENACGVNGEGARNNTFEFGIAATMRLGFLLVGFKEQPKNKLEAVAQGALTICGMGIDIAKLPLTGVYAGYQFAAKIQNDKKVESVIGQLFDPELKGEIITVNKQVIESLSDAFYIVGE